MGENDLAVQWLVMAELLRELASEMEGKARNLRVRADAAEHRYHKAIENDGDR